MAYVVINHKDAGNKMWLLISSSHTNTEPEPLEGKWNAAGKSPGVPVWLLSLWDETSTSVWYLLSWTSLHKEVLKVPRTLQPEMYVLTVCVFFSDFWQVSFNSNVLVIQKNTPDCILLRWRQADQIFECDGKLNNTIKPQDTVFFLTTGQEMLSNVFLQHLKYGKICNLEA